MKVPEDAVRSWVHGVTGRLTPLVGSSLEVDYVCLLGRKPDGRREIADFYDAVGPEDGDGTPIWEDFLNSFGDRRIVFRVHHIPTTDREPVPSETIREALETIVGLLADGRIVLIGCSMAQGRTGEVLQALRGRGDPSRG